MSTPPFVFHNERLFFMKYFFETVSITASGILAIIVFVLFVIIIPCGIGIGSLAKKILGAV
jgi:hypothetical protein